MSIAIRIVLFSALTLAGLRVNPASSASPSPVTGDLRVLHDAGAVLQRTSVPVVLTWLRHHKEVASAVVQYHAPAVIAHFRDGGVGTLFGRGNGMRIRLPAQGPRMLSHPLAPGPAGRAVILEPFATQLDPALTGADLIASKLRASGFQVDVFLNDQVTVNRLQTLFVYNVVYLHTHSGVNPGGDGVVATGQIDTGDPSVTPLTQDGSVVSLQVSTETGYSKEHYYGVTSTFIRNHQGQFPGNSLVFINGCALLKAPLFWQALQSRGVGVMISWDREATAKDNLFSGTAFFNVMSQGQDVAGTIRTEQAAGLGKSTTSDQATATLGYLGDGTITLQRAANPPSTSVPTATKPTVTVVLSPTQTPVPTATPAPTATATHVPAPPLTVVLKNRVVPGKRQVIQISSNPDTVIHLRIVFPTGDVKLATTATDGGGRARYAYVQQPNTVTYGHAQALVTVDAVKGGISTWIGQYLIGWSRIDATVQPRAQAVGKVTIIWVHSRPRTAVTVTLTFPNGTTGVLHGKTGGAGWAHLPYRVGRYLKHGDNHHVIVQAEVRIHRAIYETVTGFKIL